MANEHVFNSISELRWSRADRSAVDAVVEIEGYPTSMPYTFTAENDPLVWESIVGGEHGAIADYVAPPSPPTPPTVTLKRDVWIRMSESEADTFAATMAEAPSRIQGIWEGSPVLDHAAPEFTEFRTRMAAALGATRTVAILAPSEG